MNRIPPELCAVCKGVRRLCGAKVCPLLIKYSFLVKDAKRLSGREFYGWYSEDIFVGESGYPKIRLGPLSADDKKLPTPDKWIDIFSDLTDVLKVRLGTLYSFKPKRVDERIEEKLKELAISTKPTSVEIKLKKEPRIRVKVDPDIPPMGAVAPLEKLEVVDNISAPRKLESAVEEDVKASLIVPELFLRGINNYHLMRLLSVGLLGRKTRRRIVPTRWAITATDTILSNFFLKELRDFKEIEEAEMYYYEYLGNIYYLILAPSFFWSMEMFEVWLSNTVWVRFSNKPVIIHVYESYDGKPNIMDGGYFAIKFSVLRHLYNRRRKAAVFALRIITPKYFAPVGSWQIRESIRKALENGPNYKGEFEALLEFLDMREGDRIQFSILEKSWLLKRLKERRVTEWML